MTTEKRGLFVDDPSKLNELTILIHKTYLDYWKSIDKDYIHFIDIQSYKEDMVNITFEYNPNFMSYLLRGIFSAGLRYGMDTAFGISKKVINQ